MRVKPNAALLFLAIVATLAFTSCVTESDRLANQIDPKKVSAPIFTPEEKKVFQAKVADPFFWKVEKDGKVSYLFGTMHAGISSSQLPRRILEQLKVSKTMVQEVDLDKDNSESALTRNVRIHETLQQGDLKRSLSPAAWDILSKRTIFRDEYLDSLTPPEAYTLYELCRLLLPLMLYGSIDEELHKLSKEHHLAQVALETVVEANAALEKSATLKRVIRVSDLEAALITSERENSFFQIMKMYKSGSLPDVEKFAKPEENKFLIDARNEIWRPRLLAALAKGDCFVAVGVLHMTGPRSLLKLLAEAGYRIERI